MEHKARTIKLKEDPFREEPLPQQTLLHIYFEDRWGNSFKWIPKWLEVEKIFFKAIEVEEKNNPKGPWNEELKKASEQIPSLKEFKLPVRITCGDISEISQGGWKYKIQILVLPVGNTYVGEIGRYGYGDAFRISNYIFRMASLMDALRNMSIKYPIGLAEKCKCEGISQSQTPGEYIPGGGIFFPVWLPEGLSRAEYKIRAYIRRVILDSRSIEKGFEEI